MDGGSVPCQRGAWTTMGRPGARRRAGQGHWAPATDFGERGCSDALLDVIDFGCQTLSAENPKAEAKPLGSVSEETRRGLCGGMDFTCTRRRFSRTGSSPI